MPVFRHPKPKDPALELQVKAIVCDIDTVMALN